MKKKNIFLAVLAAVLVLSSSIGAAVAYFTTYVTAKGGYVVRIENETQIHEEVGKGQKTISIINTGNTPVFVRVKAFYSEDFTVEGGDENWVKNESDGYWYYQKAVEKTAPTSNLTLTITVKGTEWNDEDIRNVIVIYESVPAIFTAAGAPDLEKGWTIGKITSLEDVTPISIGEDEP